MLSVHAMFSVVLQVAAARGRPPAPPLRRPRNCGQFCAAAGITDETRKSSARSLVMERDSRIMGRMRSHIFLFVASAAILALNVAQASKAPAIKYEEVKGWPDYPAGEFGEVAGVA